MHGAAKTSIDGLSFQLEPFFIIIIIHYYFYGYYFGNTHSFQFRQVDCLLKIPFFFFFKQHGRHQTWTLFEKKRVSLFFIFSLWYRIC